MNPMKYLSQKINEEHQIDLLVEIAVATILICRPKIVADCRGEFTGGSIQLRRYLATDPISPSFSSTRQIESNLVLNSIWSGWVAWSCNRSSRDFSWLCKSHRCAGTFNGSQSRFIVAPLSAHILHESRFFRRRNRWAPKREGDEKKKETVWPGLWK